MRNEAACARLVVRTVLGLLLSSAVALEAYGQTISLEWRPASQTIVVGSNVSIGLYAVADGPGGIPISVMDVIVQWDPSFLDLVGINNNGPYTWLASGFPGVGDSGLNATFADGDAFYNAQSQLGNPAVASPAGLLITTFEFVTLNETPSTKLFIPETLGGAETIIINGIPGLDVHGSLGNATVRIVTILPCDFDMDGDVDLSDFAIFSQCFSGALMPPSPSCPFGVNADLDSDGDVDLADFAFFSQKFTGPL